MASSLWFNLLCYWCLGHGVGLLVVELEAAGQEVGLVVIGDVSDTLVLEEEYRRPLYGREECGLWPSITAICPAASAGIIFS